MGKDTENSDLQKEFGNKLLNHDYDGIKELNNPAPKWVMAIFLITIVFSLIYFVYYFMMDGPTQDQEYLAETENVKKEVKQETINEFTPVILTDSIAITEGNAFYTSMNCASCHGLKGEGNAIGPNLADSTWIHGCDVNSVFNILKKGKGTMPGFKTQMDDEQLQKLTSFILTKIKGSNPENPKAAEGVPCQ